MIGREGLHRTVLLDLFERAGAGAPRSYISTGNVTFAAHRGELDHITRTVEHGIQQIIGRHEPIYVRSIEFLEELVASNPFGASPYPDPYERVVLFTRDPVEQLELPVESHRADVVVFAATDRELFAVNRLVDGRTSGAGGRIEDLLGARVTSRSWNTVLRIVADPE